MRIVAILLAITTVSLASAAYLGRPHGYNAPLQVSTPGSPTEVIPPVKTVVVHYRAVLVAGDASIPNFDNATDVLAKRLERSGDDVRVLTSNGHLVTGPRWYAASWTIYDAFYDVKPDEGCLIFVTSHGNEYGLVMGLDNRDHYFLTPTRLSQILTRRCKDRPTVAILSGCHTGTFLKPEMESPNRIILTAARKDRTSFGCSADLSFTYFDECLLEAMGSGGTWARIFDDTKACVEKKETAGHITPSLPQAYFGSAVQNLGIE
jgi:hypothetical protein